MKSKNTRVIVETRNLNVAKFIKVITKELAPYLNRDIRLYTGRTWRVPNPKEFRICLWSSRSLLNRTAPTSIWGIKVDHTREAWRSTKDGVHFKDGRYCVASLYDDCDLHIHHGIYFRGGTRNEQQLLTAIFRAVVEYFQSDEWINRERKAFIKALSFSGKRPAASRIKTLQTKYDNKLQELDKLREELEDIAAVGNAEEKIKAELKRISNTLGVTRVTVEDSKVNVYTNMLYCPHSVSGNIHAMGRFRITISFTSAKNPSDSVRWRNISKDKKYRPQGYRFPHDLGNGRACLGNAYNVVLKLIKRLEIAAVAIYAIKFIQSANVKDPIGCRLKCWPIYLTNTQVEKRKTPIKLAQPAKKKAVVCAPKAELKRLLKTTCKLRASKVEDDIHECQKELEQLRGQLTKALRNKNRLTKQRAVEEYDKLKGLKNVKQVWCSYQAITIETSNLKCTSRTGSVRNIGRFDIRISFDKGPLIVWQNLSRTRAGKPAPFVEKNGEVHIKKAAAMFMSLISSNEIALVAAQAIRFVQTDIGDGKEVAKWPLYKKATKKKATKKVARARSRVKRKSKKGTRSVCTTSV